MTQQQQVIFIGKPGAGNEQAGDWLACYESWIDAQRSDRTREEYAAWLEKFVRFVGKFPDEITGVDGQAWVNWLKEHGGRDGEGHKEASINAAVAAVSSFYNFAGRYEYRPRQYLSTFNPMASVKRPKVNRYEHARWLSAEQVVQLLNSSTYEEVIEARDYAILLWYLFTARRREELLTILWGDIQNGQRDSAKVYRYRGKGNKVRWKTLPDPVWQATLRYLQLSQRLETMRPASPLFVPTNTNASREPKGKPQASGLERSVKAYKAREALSGEKSVASRTLYEIVSRAVRRAGLPNVGVHGLRHTAARMRRRLGISVEDLQEFLEHDNIDTTMIYVKETEAKEDEGWVQVAVLLGLKEQPGQEDPSTPVTPAVWDDRTSVLAASFLAEVPSMDEVVQAGIQVLEQLVDGQSAAVRWGEEDRAVLLTRFEQAIRARLSGGLWPGEEKEAEDRPREPIDMSAWLEE